MSIPDLDASKIPTGTFDRPHVWLWRPTAWRTQAVCDSGFKGPRRLLTSAARIDAYDHTHRTSHLPAEHFETWPTGRQLPA